ncbi:probable rRNA-processing protein EBP2 isoform X2 [Ambystoma mexicanum]|uniref:probable rRNA-processing protein EBP2 isoform X2 n=1 Tax=Ambystoma mexicanum TaxID=8296 RepID=UPI0037E8A4BF
MAAPGGWDVRSTGSTCPLTPSTSGSAACAHRPSGRSLGSAPGGSERPGSPVRMSDYEEESASEAGSDADPCEMTDKELQDAFAQGKLKPGLNVVLEAKKKPVNSREGLKQCLADFQKDLSWVERLDVTTGLAPDVEGLTTDKSSIDADDDFQREMSFYRQAQAAVLEALPRLKQFRIPTRRPEDYFAEMAKTDQQMQKIRKKLQEKQSSMDKSEKAKQLRALRKYGKKVQTEVLQKRQKEKSSMMNSIKKYQKGITDRLDFLEGDKMQPQKGKPGGAAAAQKAKKGPNAKRRFKDEKFGFGGRKKGNKRNTKESFNDVSGFRASVAHNKGRPGKKGSKMRTSNKRPGKAARQKQKSRAR